MRKGGRGIRRDPEEGTGLADMAVGELISKVLKEISEQGGLNVNLNLTVNFTGLSN
jgi:hypothetical protein